MSNGEQLGLLLYKADTTAKKLIFMKSLPNEYQ